MPSPDEPPRSRGRVWLRSAAVVLLVAATWAGAVYAALPWLAAVLAPRLAGPLGLDELQVSIGRPGWKGLRVGSVVLASGRVRLTTRGGRITYRPGALLDGRLERVQFREVNVLIAGGAAPAAAGRAPPPSIQALFAALPAEQISVEDLQVQLPALDFRAAGTLALREHRLDVHLDGLSPVEAERFELSAQVSADGTVALRLGERNAGQPPFVVAASRVAGDRLALDGEVDVRGFALDLAAAFAGLPAGQGRVTGAVSASVPWPLPDRWQLDPIAAQGALHVDWQPQTAPWQLSGWNLDWRLRAGEIQGEGAGIVSHGDRRFRLDAALASFRPGGPEGSGTVVLALPDGDTPLLDAAWVLAPDALNLSGQYRLPPPQIRWLTKALDLPPGEGSLAGELSTRLPWPLPERWQDLRPPSRGSVSGHWRQGALELQRLQGEWRLQTERLSGRLDGLARYEGLAVAAGVEIERLTLTGDAVEVQGIGGLGETLRLPFTGRYRPDSGTGSLSARGDVGVDGPLAEGLVQGWSEPYDLTGGQLVVAADLAWSSGHGPHGSVTVEMVRAAGHYQDYLWSGLSGTLAFSAPAEGAWALAPSALRLARVDTGVEVRDVNTTLAWAGRTLTVQATTARVLGGTARVDAFAYDMDAGDADFVVDLEDLELARILALEGEHVSGTGIVDGTLPVRLRDNVPGVVAGRVRSDPPGGEIHVSSALAGGTGQPGLDFALRALQDFRYSVLQADVAYSGSGDLSLAVHLEGRNPQIEGGRPIHYNVTVNENVPTLLKSLRLQDELTRQIERRVTD